MLQYFETLTDLSGNALLGATVTVTNYPSGSAATIYSTNGTANPIANNTVAADISGQVSFYIPDGAYVLTYVYQGTQYKVKSPVQMIDPMAFTAIADTGAANAYVVTDQRLPANLYTGLKVEVLASNTNTGASTLNVNATGAQPFHQPGGSALAAGMVQAAGIVRVEWDGTQWQLIGSQSQPFYAQTQAEINAGVVPSNTSYQPGWAPRYGVIGNGSTDDTAGMKAMLSCSSLAIVPFGLTPLISSGLTISAHCALEFQGGYGNANGALPASYVTMASSMSTGAAITLSSGSVLRGGGVIGSAANTGGGIVIAGNGAQIDRAFVQGTGGDGFRVGTATGTNCNAFRLTKCISIGNSGKGFNIHDGTSSAAANVNAGVLDTCFAQLNGSHGFYVGHAWWVLILCPLSESNTGYGMYYDGTNDTSGVPICRYPTTVGGDANEGNTAGQWFDQSYFGIFINPDGNNIPTTAVGALAGSGNRTVLCARSNLTYGFQINSSDGSYPLNVNDGTASGMTYPLEITKTTGGNNGDGSGFAVNLSGVQAGSFRVQQVAASKYGFVLSAYGTAAVDMLTGNPNVSAIYPSTDNVFACGFSSNRYTTVYATTGTINTSDAESKTQVTVLSDKEQAVAKRLKALVRRYRYKDAVAVKGEKARFHVGIIAQDVAAAFAEEGLDASEYGMFCQDKMPDGSTLSGVRYDELMAFMVAAI